MTKNEYLLIKMTARNILAGMDFWQGVLEAAAKIGEDIRIDRQFQQRVADRVNTGWVR
jgi:hypothetical protein